MLRSDWSNEKELQEDRKGRCVGGRKAHVFEKIILQKGGYFRDIPFFLRLEEWYNEGVSGCNSQELSRMQGA